MRGFELRPFALYRATSAWRPRTRLLWSAAIVCVYVVAFFPLAALFRAGTMAFSAIPVGAVGVLYGARAGALAGVLLFPLNLLLLNLAGYPGLEVILSGGAAGGIALVALGAVVGWLRDLSELLHDEARQLAHERDSLKIQAADLRRSEGAMRAAYGHMRSVLTSLPIIVFAYDREGMVRLAEGQDLEVLGFGPDQVAGATVDRADERVPGARRSFERALAGEAFTTMHRLGESAYEVRYAPLCGNDGEVIGVIGVAIDIHTIGAHEPEASAD